MHIQNDNMLTINDDSLDANVTFMSNFRSYHPSSFHTNKPSQSTQPSTIRRDKLIEQFSSNQSLFKVKNPLDNILSTKRHVSTTKDVEMRLSKNRFNFSEKQTSNNHYVFSRMNLDDGLNRLIKDQKQEQSELRRQDMKSSE